MQPTLVIIACLSVALGLRMSRNRIAKKLGALVFILSMAYLGYALFHHWLGALLSAAVWFLLPLVEIFWKRAKEEYPIAPAPLTTLSEEDETFFPHAHSYRMQLEEIGFEEVDQQSWQWLDAQQHHRFYWHPEICMIASVCLCELEKIAFTYIIFHSELADGTVLKTTNYPFTSPLKHPPKTHWKHVPCEEKLLPVILKSHRNLISRHNTSPCSVLIPDPEGVPEKWVNEYVKRMHYNMSKGIIKVVGKHCKYTPYGYFYLWLQAVKDFIRLC